MNVQSANRKRITGCTHNCTCCKNRFKCSFHSRRLVIEPFLLLSLVLSVLSLSSYFDQVSQSGGIHGLGTDA